MIISLNKNSWLWNWIYDIVNHKDPDFSEYLITAFSKTRPEDMKIQLIMKLASFGYKVKITSTKDALISMTEEEYIFLKLKYS